MESWHAELMATHGSSGGSVLLRRAAASYGFLLYDHFSPENPRNDVTSKRANDLTDERSTRRSIQGRLKRLGSGEESFSFLEARPLREDYSLRLLSRTRCTWRPDRSVASTVPQCLGPSPRPFLRFSRTTTIVMAVITRKFFRVLLFVFHQPFPSWQTETAGKSRGDLPVP